jgi:hypothetical protein
LTYCFATMRMDQRNKTHVACASHAWFIFNVNTEISSFTDHILQYLHIISCPIQSNPLLPATPCLLSLRTSFFARGGVYPSTLVPGLPTTIPPFASSPTLSHLIDQVTIFT